MRDTVIAAQEKAETLAKSGPEPDKPEKPGPVENDTHVSGKQPKRRRKRNHRIPTDYFRHLDAIIADSYTKQKAAFEVAQSFEKMMEAQGIQAVFEDDLFERAAKNMAAVSMIREMAWLFGLGPEHADRIAGHVIDRYFAPAQAQKPKVEK
jgi:hypothetical protein